MVENGHFLPVNISLVAIIDFIDTKANDKTLKDALKSFCMIHLLIIRRLDLFLLQNCFWLEY